MQEIDLSLIQEDIWTEQFAWTGSSHLNIGGYTRLEGELNLSILEQALNLLAAENCALRLLPNKNKKQLFLDHVDYTLEIKDFREFSIGNAESMAREWQQNWMSLPFSSDNTPPNRFAVLRVSEKVQYIVVQCLHSVMDGWSTSLIIQKWAEVYTRLLGKGELQNPSKSYLDFITDSHVYKASASFKKDQTFWRSFIPELPEPLFNKKYHPNDNSLLALSHIHYSDIGRDFFSNLNEFCSSYKLTNFHGFLAMLAIYLCRTQNATQVVIGVPNLNRSGGKYKSTLGMFVNVLPILIDFNNSDTFLSLTEQIKKKLALTYRHAKYPAGEHYKNLGVIKKGRERVFDVLLSYENFDFESRYGDAVVTSTQQTFSGVTRYPLALTITDFEQHKAGEMIVETSEEYFSKKETSFIASRLMFIGKQLLTKPSMILEEVLITPKAERQAQQFLSSELDPPSFRPYFQDIDSQSHHFSNSAALVWQEGELSHKEMEHCINVLVAKLKQKGIKAHDVVAFNLNRGPLSVLAMVAINKISAAFLPLDIQSPSSRVEFILSDSNAAGLIIEPELNSLTFKGPILELNLANLLLCQESNQCEVSVEPEDTAYICYTSGTTGTPKGVEVPHNALFSRLNWIAEHWNVNNNDVSLQATQHHFDPALIECLVPLMRGGAVAFPDKGTLLPESLPKLVKQFSATMMAFVPSTLSRFLDGCTLNELPLRVCCCGGEVLSPALVDRFYQTLNAELFNVYGPTEATIFATSWSTKLSSRELRELPIGQALPGTYIYILDENLNQQPFGVVGEVFIAGDSLAKGYVKASQKDQDRFSADNVGNSGYMFRTGDLGWLDTDGNIHFIGRNDRQVKLKGYRIELDEVESALKRLDIVKDAAVKFFDNSKEPQIHAWVTLRSDKPENIRAELAKLLPSYMLPNNIFVLCKLPYTTSEKVDYSALVPELSSVINPKVRSSQGGFEKRVLACWQSVLKNKELTVFDNFFEVGGDSLAAVIVITELEREYNHSFSLHQLINNPTVAELASFIEQELKLPKVLVSLGDTLLGTSLFIAASGNNDALRFQSLANEMKGFCDLYMLQPPGNEVNLTTKELAALYADEIAEKGTEKVYLAGFSIGGLAALETAKQLQIKNIQVEHLFIVDSILVALPSAALFLWHSLSNLENKLGRFAKYLFPPYLRSLLNDKGLFLQVKAMKRYQLEKGSFKVSLLKSNSFGWLQPYLAKKWRRVFGEQLHEFKIETTHSGFFETGKVSELAQILKTQILKSGS